MISTSVPRDRLPALDGLRGIAAVGVIFNHLGPLASESPWLAPLVWVSLFGWTGVDLFFVLSGFLITGILMNQKNAPNYFLAFYTHRALRIFPLYFLLLLVFTGIIPIFFTRLAPAGYIHNIAPGHVWPYWLFLSNLRLFDEYLVMAIIPMISPAWSLAIEEQFYIAWSVAVRWLNMHHLAVLALMLLLGGIGLRFTLLIHFMKNDISYNETLERHLSTIFYFTLTHLDGLCFGILIRLLYDRLRFRPLLTMFARTWWMWVAVFAALLVADDQIGWPQTHNWYQPAMLVFGFTVIALLFASIILHGLLFDGWVRKVFDMSVLKRLGMYSYCMYLFHLPVSFAVRWVIAHTIGETVGVAPLLAVEFAAVIGFAHLSYVLFESPILSLKRFAQYQAPVSRSA